MGFHLNFDNKNGILEIIAKARTSDLGRAGVGAVLGYFTGPFAPVIEDESNKNIWKPIVEAQNSRREHTGIVRAPVGYTTCHAEKIGEVSEVKGSSISVSLWRGTLNSRNTELDGVGWRSTTPAGGHNEVQIVTWFIHADPDTMSQLSDKCDHPSPFVILSCTNQDCTYNFGG